MKMLQLLRAQLLAPLHTSLRAQLQIAVTLTLGQLTLTLA